MLKDLIYVHRLAFHQSSQFIRKALGNTLLICILLGFSLSLPAIFATLLLSAGELTSEFESERTLTIFFDSNLDVQAAQSIASELELQSKIQAVRYLSPNQALQEFEQTIGIPLKGEGLIETSPLPPTAIVTLSEEAEYATLANTLKSVDGINEVVFDQVWVDRVNAVLTAGVRLLYALSALLAVSILLVISNMLIFTLRAQSDEFRLLNLVGATRSYIARPFLYTGFNYGLGGGLIAAITITTVSIWISNPLGRLYATYGIKLSPEAVVPQVIGFVLLFGIFLGWAGAQIAVWIFFRKEETYQANN